MSRYHFFLSLALSTCFMPWAEAAPNLHFCVELIRSLPLGLSEQIQIRRARFSRIVYREEAGRLVGADAIAHPQETFDYALGLIQQRAPLTLNEYFEAPLSIRPTLATLIPELELLYPLVGADAVTAATFGSRDPRHAKYNFDDMTNAYTVFNDYRHALENAYRQIIVAAEAHRMLAPHQSVSISRAQVALLRDRFDWIEGLTIHVEPAIVHEIALSSGVWSTPYANLDSRIDESAVAQALRDRSIDEYFKTYFLYERIYEEVDFLENMYTE